MSEANWYIIHVLSGSEKKIAAAIKEKVERSGFQDKIVDILIPSDMVPVVKKGKKVEVEQRLLPGYILVKMIMSEDAWHLIRSVPKVSGFLGSKGKATPLSESEIKRIMSQIEEGSIAKQYQVVYEVGDNIKVIDGPFEGFTGIVEETEQDKQRLKVSVSILGRATKVDLEFRQVEKA